MDSSQKYQELRNKTIPGLFLERVKTAPNKVAYRTKKLGIYKERTWLDFYRMVANCAMGLSQLGLKRGDCIGLIGDPCEEYTICELAGQSLGAVTFGIYPNSPQNELYFLINDARACLIIAENQEYVDRVLPFLDRLPHLQRILIINTKGLFMLDHPSLISYEKLIKMGEEQLKLLPRAFEEIADKIKPTDGLFIIYTSGTSGNPKGVLMSHGNHLAATYTLIERYPILAKVPHRTVAYLPLSHAFGKVVAITLPLLAPIIPHYGEDTETLSQTFFEIAPTLLFTAPGYLKRFASNILVGIENSSSFKKIVYSISLKIGRQHVKNCWEGKKSLLSNFAYYICYLIAFRPILNKIGFNKLRIVLSTGSPLPTELMTLWQMYGVNVSEMYGLSETGGGIVAGQGSYFTKPGDVGLPPTCWEVKLAESGEILVRGNGVFEGYWNNPKLTREVLDPDGWFHTGDVGEWTPNGNLKVVERKQDFISSPDGKRLSPMSIENVLRSNPYINEAVIIGHHGKHLFSLIEIDFETVSSWASRNNISFTGFTSLIQHPEVIKFIDLEIEEVNKTLPPDQQIRAFRIIPKELNPAEDEGPLTPTRKIKRQRMVERFRELIESMVHDG